MSVQRVVFLHGLKPAQLELVLAARLPGFEVVALANEAPEEEQLAAVAQADFLMIYRARPSEAVLLNATKVRMLQLLAAGYDQLNIEPIRTLGIPCANNGGANSWAVADQAVLLMLALYRKLIALDADVRAGRWQKGVDGTGTFELAGKVVGVLGLGNIGRQVARRVQAFDATVQYFNRTALPPEQEKALGVTRVAVDELFRTSDILTLHSPLTEQTRHLVNHERLAMMKPSAIIINTARGAVIDEAALIDALRSRRIAGAGLDAFTQEPVQADNPLLALDNVIVSPHSGGTTADTWRRRGDFAFRNFNRVLAGASPESLITLPAAKA